MANETFRDIDVHASMDLPDFEAVSQFMTKEGEPTQSFFDMEDVTPIDMGDLDDAVTIHAVFSQKNFPNINYSVLKTSLRAASLILSSPNSIRFFRTLISGDRVPLHGEQRDFAIWEEHKQPLTQLQVHMTHEALADLARGVSFVPTTTGQRYGGCKYRYDQPAKGRFFAGYCSEINYSQDFYDDARQLREQRENGDVVDTAKELHITFWFVRVILHELAHAMFGAVTNGYEPFFEDHPAAELGFEYESMVLGGLYNSFNPDARPYWYAEDSHECEYYTDTTPSDIGGVLCITRWPCASTVRSYCIRGSAMAVRTGAELLDLTPHVRVPLAHVQQIFTKAFWRSMTPEALHPSFIGPVNYTDSSQAACEVEIALQVEARAAEDHAHWQDCMKRKETCACASCAEFNAMRDQINPEGTDSDSDTSDDTDDEESMDD